MGCLDIVRASGRFATSRLYRTSLSNQRNDDPLSNEKHPVSFPAGPTRAEQALGPGMTGENQ
jgi:hypothetical protein